MLDDELHNAGLSAAARDFLTAAQITPYQPITRESIVRTRQQLRETYRERCEQVVQDHAIEIAYEVVNGIQSLVATPRNLRHAHSVVLYFYGGGYVTGSPLEDLRIIAPLSDTLGIKVVAPTYRLAPEHPFPAAPDDAMAVYQAVISNYDSSRVLLAGESAGGNLALSLLQQATAHGLDLPSAVALLSPWCDLTHQGDSLVTNNGRDPTLALAFVEDAANHYVAETAHASPLVSPLFADFRGPLPPTIITSGTRDLLLSQAVRLADKLRDAGTRVDLDVREGMWHVYEFYPELPEAQHSIARICDFLQREGIQPH